MIIVAAVIGFILGATLMSLAKISKEVVIDNTKWHIPEEQREPGTYIVLICGATVPTILTWNGESWRDNEDIWYAIEKWAYLPE